MIKFSIIGNKLYICVQILYNYILWYVGHTKLYTQHGYGRKHEIFYCAISCPGYGPYIHRSNFTNCKFTLALFLIVQDSLISPSWHER